MIPRAIFLLLLPCVLSAEWLLIRTIDGKQMEVRSASSSLTVTGGPGKLRFADVLSIHSGAPASEFENERITAGLAALQGKDRKASAAASEELTVIGVPVVTPLLKTLKDTDQHEPRPLYRLFERVMPSSADGLDRTLTLVRLADGKAIRCTLPTGDLAVVSADGGKSSIPWASIRSIGVRRGQIRKVTPVHSLRHSTQIEYLDTGVVLTSASKVHVDTQGFVRLSWNDDGWSSDPDGLKKPGSPAYKTNLVDGHPFGALVGRVGAGGEVFFVGRSFSKSGLPAGRLELAVNDNAHWQNNLGQYTVTLTATDAYDVGDAQ